MLHERDAAKVRIVRNSLELNETRPELSGTGWQWYNSSFFKLTFLYFDRVAAWHVLQE